MVIPGEGLAYAEYMESAGYMPFVLRYRVAPDAYPYPQQDLALAIKYIRKNADKYGIDGHNLLLMGFSAGGRKDMKEKVSVERHISEDYPKTFLWFCNDDKLVLPKHGKLMYEALKEKNVECMKCEYPTGGHGCGLAKGTSAEGWIDTMLEFMKD